MDVPAVTSGCGTIIVRRGNSEVTNGVTSVDAVGACATGRITHVTIVNTSVLTGDAFQTLLVTVVVWQVVNRARCVTYVDAQAFVFNGETRAVKSCSSTFTGCRVFVSLQTNTCGEANTAIGGCVAVDVQTEARNNDGVAYVCRRAVQCVTIFQVAYAETSQAAEVNVGCCHASCGNQSSRSEENLFHVFPSG